MATPKCIKKKKK